VIDETVAAHQPVGAPATWVLSNHDVTRHVSRYGRADTSFDFETRPLRDAGGPRARHPPGAGRGAAEPVAARIRVPLPGRGARPLGGRGHPGRGQARPDVLPHRGRRTRAATAAASRCPGPATAPPFGFSPDDATAEPWLPQQPASWSRMTVEAEQGDPDSMLELYRTALRLRRAEPGLRSDREPLRWLPADPEVLAYRRGEDFACVINFGPQDAELPAYTRRSCWRAARSPRTAELPGGHRRLAPPQAGRSTRTGTTQSASRSTAPRAPPRHPLHSRRTTSTERTPSLPRPRARLGLLGAAAIAASVGLALRPSAAAASGRARRPGLGPTSGAATAAPRSAFDASYDGGATVPA
jgi:hypothetical protein